MSHLLTQNKVLSIFILTEKCINMTLVYTYVHSKRKKKNKKMDLWNTFSPNIPSLADKLQFLKVCICHSIHLEKANLANCLNILGVFNSVIQLSYWTWYRIDRIDLEKIKFAFCWIKINAERFSTMNTRAKQNTYWPAYRKKTKKNKFYK